MANQNEPDKQSKQSADEGDELAGERMRDEKRLDGGPRYGGRLWEAADARGEHRYGIARNDDADPSELERGEAMNDDNEAPNAVDPELAEAEQNAEIESGAGKAGMRRGEEPRKAKDRERR
jgi:hypothetical protein